MKKAEIIIIITIVVLAIAAIVVGVFAFKEDEETSTPKEDKIGNFFSELFEKKPEEPDVDPVEPFTTEEPDETEPEDDEPYGDINDFYEYDDNGNIIKEDYGDYVLRHEYDSKNRKIRTITYDEKGDIQYWSEFEYKGNSDKPSRKETKDANDEHISTIIYEYGSDGSYIESGYLPNGILMDKTYFDKSGFIVRAEYYYKDYMAQLYEFDPETFCAKQTNYDEDGNVTYYAEYDENGDLVKEEIYE